MKNAYLPLKIIVSLFAVGFPTWIMVGILPTISWFFAAIFIVIGEVGVMILALYFIWVCDLMLF